MGPAMWLSMTSSRLYQNKFINNCHFENTIVIRAEKDCILISTQVGIRDLMWFSDLENLLSIGRIFYQLGESYLNLFLLHKVENLWSVRNLWSIFTSLSALEDFLSDLGEGGGGLLPPNKRPSINVFQLNMSHKMLSFWDFTLFWYYFFNRSIVFCNGTKRSGHSDHTLQI